MKILNIQEMQVISAWGHITVDTIYLASTSFTATEIMEKEAIAVRPLLRLPHILPQAVP